MNRNRIGIAVAFTVGALVGGTFTGAATAQRPAAGRYEYKCMNKWPAAVWSADAQTQINDMSAQGWRWMAELARPNNTDVYCFEKRL